MKRRSTTSHSTTKAVRAWAAPAGALATAAVAALLSACPVDVTVTVGVPAHTVVVSQADIPNPVCEVRPR
ncbi:hypothetical protein ACIRU8_37715 [Streptomyces sp. NPDC101175]|uniref:hypothetical protein n=1 Tax=Streptomyces sp. NPDC101175 TaxID=3366123 RepID=UPI0038368CD8